MPIRSTELFPGLLTMAEFAKQKDVTKVAVWNHVNNGNIEVVYVGKGKKIFIDETKYAGYTFNENAKRNFAK